MSRFYNVTCLAVAILVAHCVSVYAQPRWDWVKPINGSGFIEGASISWSPFGEILVGGTFSDSLKFGSQPISSLGNYDIFTALLKEDGTIRRVEGIGGPDVEDLKSVLFDNKGNSYVCGSFVDNVKVGAALLESKEIFGQDIFLAKYNKNGIQEWSWVEGSPSGDDEAPFVAVDSLGSIYLAGSFEGTTEFGTKSAISAGRLDVYVVKISATGAITWLQRAGGLENDVVKSISVSPNGDRIYITGTFNQSATFGGTILQSYDGKPDFFVQCLNAAGTQLWVKRFGYTGEDRFINACADKDGKLLITGAMNQTMTFDTQTLQASGGIESDVFVCRLAKDGTFELLKSIGGVYSEVGLGIAADALGGFFVTGYFMDAGEFGGTILNSAGGRDGFVFKCFANGTVEWARSFGGVYADEGKAITLSADNIPYITGYFETKAFFGPIEIKGQVFTDGFVAALECGPNTMINPAASPIKICEGQDQVLGVAGGYPEYKWFVNDTEKAGVKTNRYMLDLLPIGTHKIYCRIRDFYSCSKNTDTLTVEIRAGLAKPTIFKTADSLVCSAFDVTYEWYREGSVIAASKGRSTPIVGQGLYRVLISDSTGCRRWSDDFLVGTTDVFEPGVRPNTVSVFPNPVNDVLSVTGVDDASITVMDVTGRVLITLTAQTGNILIPMQVVSGTYIVKIDQLGVSSATLITKH